MIKQCLFALTLISSQAVFAGENYSLPENWDQGLAEPLILASAGDNSVDMNDSMSKEPFKERMFTANKIHKYLGIGSIAAAGLTLLTPPENEGNTSENVDGGIHETFARTATGLGIGAVLTGLLFHWDDITLSNGIKDPDNIHATLATLGTLGYLKAVNEAPDSSHSGYGAMGAISMAIGIKMVW